MDKQILYQYIDACELVKETEQEIEQIRRRRREIVTDKVKMQVEEWMVTVPLRMQRIIRYKVFEGMTWAQVAQRMGKYEDTGMEPEKLRKAGKWIPVEKGGIE